MRINKRAGVKSLFLVLLLLFSSSFVLADFAGVASPSGVSVGDVFMVNVSVDGSDVSGVEFTLLYDASVLQAANVSVGGFFADSVLVLPSDLSRSVNESGRVWLASAVVGGDGVSGSGVVANVAFHAVSAGVSYLNLVNVTVVNDSMVSVSAGVQNSTVNVSYGGYVCEGSHPPAEGDWVVNEYTTCVDESISLGQNGWLVINDSQTLVLNSTVVEQHNSSISFEGGGTVELWNSNITFE